ncbi:unnamed protein product [Orchesella dallaii]|uniref:Cytochrome P450 9e2 n=1 Tax=Orchesella dallaii TaxID=48710 RepID=A0ABP1Q3Q4_9HEXA
MWFALIAVIVIGYLLYKLLLPSDTKNFWAQYGIRQIDGSPAASEKELLSGKKDVTARDGYAYEQLSDNEKFCGMIESPYKMIFIKDLELAKRIFIRDFGYFTNRRQFFVIPNKDSIVNKLLNVLKGQEWKNVRSTISPAFTTGKIRRYMESFNSIGKDWIEVLKEKANDSSTKKSVIIKVLPTVSQFTTDVIATGVFGFNAGTVRNPNSTFATMVTRLATMNQWKIALSMRFPSLFKLLGIEIIDMEAFTFFQNIVAQGLKARMSGDTTKRNDFLQMMVELKKGELKSDGKEELSSFEKDAEMKAEKSSFVLTDDIINAQSVTFFFAGFSTTSNFLAFVFYCLAAHQDVQDKLREEVRKIVQKDGTFEYDAIGKLVYMDMVCCGMRLALVESKAAIAHVLHNFRIEPAPTTKIPVEGVSGSLQILPPDDLELKFTIL